MIYWDPLLEGVVLSAGLILAIGAQNAFIIRQGARGHHVLAVALTCTLSDFFLITLGALGIGGFISGHPALRRSLTIVGISFLLCYGIASWMRVVRGAPSPLAKRHDQTTVPRAWKLVLMALGFSLLNPHAIVDTVVLIGGFAARHEEVGKRVAFTIGAALVSLVWLFGLAYGARLLREVLARRLTAQIFDGIVGTIMFGLMGSLAYTEFIV